MERAERIAPEDFFFGFPGFLPGDLRNDGAVSVYFGINPLDSVQDGLNQLKRGNLFSPNGRCQLFRRQETQVRKVQIFLLPEKLTAEIAGNAEKSQNRRSQKRPFRKNLQTIFPVIPAEAGIQIFKNPGILLPAGLTGATRFEALMGKEK
jgi:hypothetical protein